MKGWRTALLEEIGKAGNTVLTATLVGLGFGLGLWLAYRWLTL